MEEFESDPEFENSQAFESYRPMLFGIAYRMLGSAMEAEDVIQEAYLRYTHLHEQIQTPKAYLGKIVTNLCLDQLKSAREKREVYVGSWLPEPILTTESTTERELDSLSMAFMVLLEQLSPAERAVFLLHEVFDYAYPEIAGILGKDPATCRQLLHRAKQHIVGQRPRFNSTPEEHQAFLGKFLSAVTDGDVDGLVSLLAEDVSSWADGGGKVSAAISPVIGRDRVIKIIIGLRRFYTPEMTTEITLINGCPGVVIREHGEIRAVYIFELDNGVLQYMRVILNPDKLQYLAKTLPQK
ncbi:MAG TPA: RNA polymerase sigma-70 factor [Phototrophicaceae bacterium]|jgi:RNA polymerase sigma-70 factor (ECF subfamily)|nr:RNA polymerase sigma-70 factor [Phototrophicaceae bacterium]